MRRARELWQRLTSTEGWSCPGDGCSGLFRTPERANEHAWVVRASGSHDVAAQRRFLRERNRKARQLRRRGVAR